VRAFRLVLAGLAIVALTLPVVAGASVQLSNVDASAYPTMRASVVSSAGATVIPTVSESGIPVAGFQAVNLAHGKSVVLAVDRSQSMKGEPLAHAIAAARVFVNSKPRSDRIAVTAFATKPRFVTGGFSPQPVEALGALSSIKVDPEQGTTLFDNIVLAAQRLAREDFAGRVIIMVTDGNETRSKASLTEAIAAARESSAAVYVVGIESSRFNPEPLKELAAGTGGRYYATASSKELTGVYKTIAATLKKTWRIEYLTTARPGESIRIKAEVIGAGTATKGFTISPGVKVDTESPSGLVPEGAYGPSGPLGLAIAVGALVLLACLFFLAGIRGSWVRSRIAGHVGDGKGGTKRKRKEKRSEVLATIFRATERAFGNLKHWRAISKVLERADVPLKTVEFFWIVVGSAMFTGMVAFLLGASPFVFLALVVIAGSLPCGWVWLKMRKRLRAFEDQLPDFLITIAASLKAGHSFKQGLQAVVDEGHPPASEEVRRVLTEASLGRPMDDALAEMAERVGSKNFEFAITAVTIQRQVGGSMATLFDMVADTVRQRQQFARKIRALTAMGRMSAYTLIGVPFFIAGMVTLLNGDYMGPLYQTSTGQMLIVIAFVMMAIGSLILKKIVSFRG
jgi:tight adherence protein B